MGSVAALATALALYAGALDAGFAFDDAIAVQTNPLVNGELPAGEAFTRDFWGDQAGFSHIASWRPLTVLSLRADAAVDAGAAWPFHATNVALHLLLVLAVLWLARRLDLPPLVAVGVAFVVAAHPVFAEAVASIVGRGDLLASLFGVSGLAAWTVHPALGLSGLTLALMAKESAVVFVGAGVLLGLRVRRDRPWVAALIVVAVCWYGVRSAMVGHLGGVVPVLDNPIVALEGTERLAAALGVMGRYLSWWLLPQQIAADHTAAVDLTGGGGFTLLGVVAGALLLIAWLRAVRTLSWAGLLGGALACASLLLLSNALFTLPTPMGGRLAYGPAIGLTLLAGAALAPLASEGPRALRYGLLAATAVWLLAGVPSTLGVVDAWQSDRALFEASVRLEPGSARAWANLGRQQLDAGELDAAETSTLAALERVPEHPVALLNLALVFEAQGRKSEAWDAAQKAAERESRPGKARSNLCAFALARPQSDAASTVTTCEIAASAMPAAVEPLVNLARSLARAGRAADAEANFLAALQRFPRSDFARGHWVGFLVSGKRLVEAVAVQRAVLADAPANAEVRRNLVALLFMLAQAQADGGDDQRACETARSAAALAPGVAPVARRAASLCPAQR